MDWGAGGLVTHWGQDGRTHNLPGVKPPSYNYLQLYRYKIQLHVKRKLFLQSHTSWEQTLSQSFWPSVSWCKASEVLTNMPRCCLPHPTSQDVSSNTIQNLQIKSWDRCRTGVWISFTSIVNSGSYHQSPPAAQWNLCQISYMLKIVGHMYLFRSDWIIRLIIFHMIGKWQAP